MNTVTNLITRPQWQLEIRYEWLHMMILNSWLSATRWRWAKSLLFPDNYQEEIADLISMYCAGGEL